MKIMAVDLGDARTGLAVCDKSEFLASPAGVIHEKNYKMILQKTASAAIEHSVEEIVVGLPKNMDGTEGERALKCRDFAKKLEEQTGLSVTLWDERSTTVTAVGYMNVLDIRGKKRKNIIDEVAAVIILENYLNWRKNNK